MYVLLKYEACYLSTGPTVLICLFLLANLPCLSLKDSLPLS